MANPLSSEYLESFGLVPNDIAVDDFNETGYWLFLRDADGDHYLDPSYGDCLAQAWTPWPESFSYDELERRLDIDNPGWWRKYD